MTEAERAALVDRALRAYMDFHAYDDVLDPEKEREAFGFVVAVIEGRIRADERARYVSKENTTMKSDGYKDGLVEGFVEDYEMYDGDTSGSYRPSENEKALLIDALHGFVASHWPDVGAIRADEREKHIISVSALGPPDWMDNEIARAGFAIGIGQALEVIKKESKT